MRRFRDWLKRETGQSMVVVAVGMVVLLTLVGLVLDAGNAYALQRKVRNAADAAALAGARELAKGPGNTRNGDVLAAVRNYVVMNYISQDNVVAWYSDVDGQPLQQINNDNFFPPTKVNGVDVSGVTVQVNGVTSSYLARLIGVDEFTSTEQSLGRVICGACSAGSGEGLFPAAISADSFASSAGKPMINQDYVFWGDKTAPGNFGWLAWNQNPSHTSETTLVANLTDLHSSGIWHVGDNIPCGPGVKNSSGVKSALNSWLNKEVTIPVYDYVSGTGANATYHVVGFLRLKITAYNFQGNDKSITGKAVRWSEPAGEGGCADLGVCVVKLRPPMTEVRSITGVVSIWKPRLTEGVQVAEQHIPVDVVNVMDISGSMNDRWGAGQEVKLDTAKRVLAAFNNQLLPAEGDKLGLVTFPRKVSGAYYRPACTSSSERYYYLAQQRSALTEDISAVNNIVNGITATGGTPLASAIQMGRETVLPTGAMVEGRVPVLIVASDGITNCNVNGRWTGFPGDTYSVPACNAMAEQDAITQANMAKEEGILIFTIAVGDDFNSNLLRAIATEDTDSNKPHFFQAVDQEDLESIYHEIATRVNNIGSECTVEEFETVGNDAVVTISKNGAVYATATTSASGSYVFTDVAPGDYTFTVSMRSDGMTFDLLTEVIGGPVVEEPVTITVGDGVGSYVKDLYLRTSTPLQCQQ